jgi:hypothetical protein
MYNPGDTQLLDNTSAVDTGGGKASIKVYCNVKHRIIIYNYEQQMKVIRMRIVYGHSHLQ